MHALVDLAAAMADLGFDLGVIEQVEAALDDGQQQISAAAKVDRLGSHSYGDLPEALELTGHTARARDTVVSALEDMVTGLAAYRSAVVRLVEESMAVEQDAVTSLTRIEQATSCVATPAFSAAGRCALPGPGAEG